MEYKVFYSWQSDLPNATNRSFIEDALRKAAKALAKDDTIDVEPVIDRDTVDVPGSPEIASTIFAKIEKSQAFVADISIVNTVAGGRLTPSPNVLVELGYAAHHLGWDRITLIFNTDRGQVEHLPFDLRGRRIVPYKAAEGETDRSAARKALISGLDKALRTMISHRPEPASTPADAAISAIENAAANRTIMVHRFWAWLDEQLHAVAPTPSNTATAAKELLINSIHEAEPFYFQFAKVAEAAAITDSDTLQDLIKGFDALLARYHPTPGSSEPPNQAKREFCFFSGQELFVLQVSQLVKHKRWARIKTLFEHDFAVPLQPGIRRSSYGSFSMLSEYLSLLEPKDSLHYLPAHASLLREMHSTGDLGRLLPLQEFIETDLLLYLRSDIGDGRKVWFPRSVYFLHEWPRLILNAQRSKQSDDLCFLLDASSIDELRENVKQHVQYVRKIIGPLQSPLAFSNMQAITAIGSA